MGAGTGALTSLAAIGLGVPVGAGVKAVGMSGIAKAVASDAIVGGGIHLGTNTYTNWTHKQDLRQNAIGSFVLGSITSGVSCSSQDLI